MKDYSSIARQVIALNRRALDYLENALSVSELQTGFNQAMACLLALKGRIIVTGIGKSGHIARKIAASFASTGTPAFYIHPSEANHGDMGMITRTDIVLVFSRSGETAEFAHMLAFCQRFSIPLIAITCNKDTSLGRASTYVLPVPDVPEACSEVHAPTTSTLLQLALGDSLAIALLEAKGFSAADFKTFHPGGALGAALLTIADLMHTGSALPLVLSHVLLEEALVLMSEKGFGCVGIIDETTDRLLGLFTDGDLRRHLSHDLGSKPVIDLMTRNPKICAPEDLAASVLRFMSETSPKVMQIFVVENARPVGIVHMHDFLRAGVI